MIYVVSCLFQSALLLNVSVPVNVNVYRISRVAVGSRSRNPAGAFCFKVP